MALPARARAPTYSALSTSSLSAYLNQLEPIPSSAFQCMRDWMAARNIYVVWQVNADMAALGSAVAVPEPSGVVVLICAGLSGALLRRRCHGVEKR